MDTDEARYRQEDEQGSAGGAMRYGVELRARGASAEAMAAFRRAEERGHPDAGAMVGIILEEQGDLAGAGEAYRRSDGRGSVLAAFNLGLLLMGQGDMDGAEAAWGRGDERGDAECSANLGSVLKKRGDLRGAEAAYRRADSGGSVLGTWQLGEVLEDRGELGEARETYGRAAERGSAPAAFSLARIHLKLDDIPAARAALGRADELGHPDAGEFLERLESEQASQEPQTTTVGEAVTRLAADAAADPVSHMAYLEGRHLYDRGQRPEPDDLPEAEVVERARQGDTGALVRLGLMRERAGDLAGAAESYAAAASQGDAYGEFRLGFMAELHDRDLDAALTHYRRADEAGDLNAAGNLGRLLKDRGDLLAAERAYGRCYERGGLRALADHAGLMMNREDATPGELQDVVVKLCAIEDMQMEAEMQDRRQGTDSAFQEVMSDTGPPVAVFSAMWENVAPATMRAGVEAADAAGSGAGAYHLGIVLRDQGELAQSAAASLRAGERGFASAWANAAACLLDLNDPNAAETAARRGDESGEVNATVLLGLALDAKGDLEGSLAANARADELGDATGALHHGIDLVKVGRHAEAEAAFLRAKERGSDRADEMLGAIRQ